MQNIIIKASAGSGKTYKLSNRYIGILFSQAAPETILASTFTRKAAGEILARILTRLSDAALCNDKYAELSEALQKDHLPPCPDAGELQRITAQTARNLYKLRISTLDSLFNKIATAFTFELGLPPGWTILDEAGYERIIHEGVHQVLADSPKNDAKKLLSLLHQGREEQTVTKEIIELAKNYLPLSRETNMTPDVWGKGLCYKKEIPEDEFNRMFEIFKQTPLPVTKKGTVNAGLEKGCEDVRLAVEKGDWKRLLEIALVKNSAGDGSYKAYNTEIDGILADCVTKIKDRAEAVLINKLIGKTQAAGKLLALITEACGEILYRERGYRFDDITLLLSLWNQESGGTVNSPLVTHRLDAETKHILLDEFQDTSLPQWNVVRAFMDNAVKTGSAFVVGDLKQAIYAWRGGVAEIFDNVKAAFTGIREETLEKSYRSSPVIIDTVNKIFCNIAQNESLQDDNYLDAAVQWSTRFNLHETAKDTAGYCVLETVDAEDRSPDNDNEENGESNAAGDAFTDYVVARIAQLHSEHKEAKIGVLVLRNKKIGSIIAGLKQRFNLEASEDGGVPLTNSNAVQFVLSAMKLADHPGDTAARYHLTLGPLGEYLGITDYKDSYQSVCASRTIRNSIAENGYGETLREYQRVLSVWCDEENNGREKQQLGKLAALAYQFDGEASGVRTRRFIERVQTAKAESPTADPIQVMTIHKSKGMEFDITVLPDLDSKLVKSSPPIIVARDHPAAPINFITCYADKDILPMLPIEYQNAFAGRLRSEVIESLDVLYVAVTRAKRELVIIVTEKGTQSFGNKTLRSLLLNALGKDYRHGNPDWQMSPYGHSEPEGEPHRLPQDTRWHDAAPPAVLPQPFIFRPAPLRHLTRKTPSGEELSMPRDGVAFSDIPSADGHGRLLGIALHQCFEYVLKKHQWLDDYAADKEELIQNVKNSETASLDWDSVADSFIAACQKPNVRQLLSRHKQPNEAETAIPASDEELEVESERRFIVRLDDNLWRGSIDRLVIRRRNGKVTALEVIDFKSDVIERTQQYVPQLEAYRKALAKLYRIEPSKITAKILYFTLDKVVTL
jgi:ATP-dependent exoDNAse (exonuclease V) beta subunit